MFPDVPLPGIVFQLLLGDPEVLPGQVTTDHNCSVRSSDQAPESGLATFGVKKQHLHSKLS